MSVTLSRELKEIQLELQSSNTNKKIYAIHKVISYMNMGKNVSGLFFSVMKCLEIRDNVEIKKLVYLYITQYSQELPDEAIMCVNSFIRDARDKRNPMVRAMALRTMGCLRVKNLNEYLVSPLNEALLDDDIYVKKTAVMTVSKIYDLNPELVEKSGMLENLLKILKTNKNPIVISNTLLALSEISRMKNENIIELDEDLAKKIVNALPECSEWGQISILEILSGMETQDARLAELIVDRVLSRLSHINPAVILSAIKVILKFTLVLKNKKIFEGICKKLSSPLISLLNSGDELSWILLKNINILILKFAKIFSDVRVFFVKYTDPSYIKMEKLNIIQKLVEPSNFKLLINEFVEYSYDLDLDFSREAVKAIWKIALKFPKQVDSCVAALQALLITSNENSFTNHILNEITIGVSYIFRKYRNKMKLNSCVNLITNNYQRINEDKSQISMLDLIPEFLDIVKNKNDIFRNYLETFANKNLEVQFSILTMSMKLYLENSEEFQEDIISLLKFATENIENPDLRDRAFIYWRLLNISSTVANKILFASREKIDYNFDPEMDKKTLDILFSKLGTLAATYYQPNFGNDNNKMDKDNILNNNEDNDLLGEEDEVIDDNIDNDLDILGFDLKTPKKKEEVKKVESNENPGDFLNLFGGKETPVQAPKIEVNIKKPVNNNSNNYGELDFLGLDMSTNKNNTNNNNLLNKNNLKNNDNLLKMNKAQKEPKKTNDEDLFGFDVLPKKEEIPIKIKKEDLKQNDISICLNINDQGKNGKMGIQIIGRLLKKGKDLYLDLTLQNFSNNTITFANLELLPNPFGLKLLNNNKNLNLTMTQSVQLEIPVMFDKSFSDNKWKVENNCDLNLILKTNFDNFSFILKSSLIPFLVK